MKVSIESINEIDTNNGASAIVETSQESIHDPKEWLNGQDDPASPEASDVHGNESWNIDDAIVQQSLKMNEEKEKQSKCEETIEGP